MAVTDSIEIGLLAKELHQNITEGNKRNATITQLLTNVSKLFNILIHSANPIHMQG